MIKAVKNYLGITWEDPSLDDLLDSIIQRGKAYLDRVAGHPVNYGEDQLARQLLMDYVRYVRENDFQNFQHDFQTELNLLHAYYEVLYYDQSDL